MDEEMLLHHQLALRAEWLMGRSRRGRSLRKTRAARRWFQRALSVMAYHHPDRSACLNNLGVLLHWEFRRTGEEEPLERLLEVNARIVMFLPPGHPDRRRHRHNLRALLAEVLTAEWRPGLAARLLPLAREAAAEEDARSGPLLAHCLDDAYRESGELSALREIVELWRASAVAGAPDPEWGWVPFHELGRASRTLGVRTGEREALAEAVECGRRAVRLCPGGHAGRAGCLRELANSLHADFVDGGPGDGGTSALREAEECAREAVSVAPAGSGERASCLSTLGIVLRGRFETGRDLAALREAVRACRESVAGLAADDTRRRALFNNLSAAEQELFKRTGEVAAAHRAVAASRAAVASLSADDPQRAGTLSELGNALHLLAATLHPRLPPGGTPEVLGMGEVPVLVEAVETAREAVALESEPRARSAALTNLSIAARTLHEHTGDRVALAEAIDGAREAVALGGGSDLAVALYTLVQALTRVPATPESLRETRRCCDALARRAAPTRVRVLAHRLLGRAAMAADPPRPDLALAAYERAVGWLPRLAPRQLLRADREFGLGEFAGLPAEAASAALALERPERAVVLLEHARGVLLREGLGHEEELDALRRAEPALAEEFALLRERLDASDRAGAPLYADGFAPPVPAAEEAARHSEWADRWEELLTRVRRLPGLAGFLLPPTPEELRRRVGDHPVVLVNPSPFRCDALILTADAPVRVVPLACAMDELRSVAEDFARHAVPGPGGATEARLLGRLEWLWERVGRPVLDALGATPGAAGGPSRVRWCPVGVAAGLPLHAAGVPGRPGDSVLDRVVSSYTTTVGALPSGPPGRGRGGRRLVVVEVARAPGARELPGAVLETRRLTELTPDATVLSGPAATREAVLAELPGHEVAHFACHAVTDPRSPSLSALLLHDHVAAPLTVLELGAARVEHGALAYLSACRTGGGEERLADEAVHIASAFQLAGYRQVVATLWPVGDGDAGRVADDFHTALAAAGTTADAASHLHHAVRALRDDAPGEPSRWAAHFALGG
ncbi:CHAT domain-containing protein [Streptomyces sedi]|uniref:CHAT domain-containing protein n=1 Tax=Streptomyces sedi TaxID=555059 RepID=A0A5C4UVM1_9ACTN|nr:CHAT domain-containing protein [Streptomyces sedi]TNM27721.1 CHAT domain-containing protein [Streptomyces sedi]